MKKYFSERNIIFFIFILAFCLRIIGLNWDQDNHLHPDERFLTMLTADISLPSTINQYFDTKTSPLNPYNNPQYKFFVYGTFPVFLTKYVAVIFNGDNYNSITIIGRILSALLDSSIIFLLYLIFKKITEKNKLYFLPSLVYALMVLPLQLSHYYAVDTFLNFFLLLTFTLLIYKRLFYASISFAIALTCKITALLFLPIILLTIIFLYYRSFSLKKILITLLPTPLIIFLVFRIFQPYSFNGFIFPNIDFINSFKSLSQFSKPGAYYPPGVQWLNRPLPLDSFINNILWGLGLPFSFLFVFLILKSLKKVKVKFFLLSIILFWICFLFFFQAFQFSHALRYFLLIYPYIAILFSYLFYKFSISKRILYLFILLHFLNALSFLGIYLRPHSRVQASQWIFKNIPAEQVLSSEYWDDALPLGSNSYQNISLTLFDPDTYGKWQVINSDLDKIDFLIMSSNRLWGSIPRVPSRYPSSSRFYRDLFSGKTNFSLIKKFVSYPGFNLSFMKKCIYIGPSNYPGIKNNFIDIDYDCDYPGIYFRDDTADESFTVYDHPQVIIFQKSKPYKN